MKLVLFDIDSTLLRDGGAAVGAFSRAFSEQFGVLPAHTDKYGKTDQVITREVAQVTLGRVLTAEEFRLLQSRFCEQYPDFLARSETFSVFPGAVELLSRLVAVSTLSVGIQTGNLEECARAKLRRAQIDRFFRFGGFGSDASDRDVLVRIGIERGITVTGWDPSATKVVVIGDSILDIAAGRANKAFTIGVATGKNSVPELRSAGADAVVKDLAGTEELMEIIGR